jgi:hypothetical protein
MRRLDAKGKGILLLHDIHQRTVDALPTILKELKAGGYRVVHVVPATPDQPKTITAAAEWRMYAPPKPMLPKIALADVSDLDSFSIAGKSASDLCELKAAPVREQRVAKPRTGKTKTVKQAAAKSRQAKPSKSSDVKKPETQVAGLSLPGIRLAEPDENTPRGKRTPHVGKRVGAKTAVSNLPATR